MVAFCFSKFVASGIFVSGRHAILVRSDNGGDVGSIDANSERNEGNIVDDDFNYDDMNVDDSM